MDKCSEVDAHLKWAADAVPGAAFQTLRTLLQERECVVSCAHCRQAFMRAAANFKPPCTLSAVERRLLSKLQIMPLPVLAIWRGVPELAAHIVAEHDFDPHANELIGWAIGYLATDDIAAFVQLLHLRFGTGFNPDFGLEEGAIRSLLHNRFVVSSKTAVCVTALLDAGAAPAWSSPVEAESWPEDEMLCFSATVLDVGALDVCLCMPVAWRGAVRLWRQKRGVWLRQLTQPQIVTLNSTAYPFLAAVLEDERLCILSDEPDSAPYRVVSELALLVALFL